jgi:hypothetical protein
MSAPTQVPVWDTNNTNAVEPTADQKLNGIVIEPQSSVDFNLWKRLNWQFKLIGEWLAHVNTGATGTFTSDEGKIITVTKGIITSIS